MNLRAERLDSGPQRRTHRAANCPLVAVLGLLLAAVGCGGKAADPGMPSELGRDGQKHEVHEGSQASVKPTDPASEPGEPDEQGMPASLAKFHDTLAPRWHAERGARRMADTCAAIAQFHADADAVAAAPPPQGADAAAWSAGGKQLTAAVVGLDATCKANDAAAFEPAFAQVHQRFHGLMEAGEH